MLVVNFSYIIHALLIIKSYVSYIYVTSTTKDLGKKNNLNNGVEVFANESKTEFKF